MARRPSSKSTSLPGSPVSANGTSPRQGKSNDITWVNTYVNGDDRKWLSDNLHALADVVFELLAELPGGYALSVKPDANSERWLAVLFCRDDQSINAGSALSVRAATPDDALFLLAYTHIYKLNRQWGSLPAEANDRWG